MPFKFAKKMLKKPHEEPIKKPIMDDIPKPVSQDTYNLPTLDDLPDMPQTADQYYGEQQSNPYPIREESRQERPLPEFDSQPLDRVALSAGNSRNDMSMKDQLNEVITGINRIESTVSSAPNQDAESHHRIMDSLGRIERRVADMDRRLALLERTQR